MTLREAPYQAARGGELLLAKMSEMMSDEITLEKLCFRARQAKSKESSTLG